MKCEDFGKYLDNYENLTELQRSEMTDHAAICEKCQAELDFFLSMISTVKSLPKIEPPGDFLERLNQRLDAEDEKVIAPSKIIYHVRRNWKQYATAAACFALVATLTANRGIIMDSTPESDPGDVIISSDTVAASDSGASNTDTKNNTPQNTELDAADIADANAAVDRLNPDYITPAVSVTPSVRPAQRAASVASSSRTSRSAASSSVSSPAETPAKQSAPSESTAAAANDVIESVPAADAIVDNTADTSKNKVNDDYGIALSGSTRTTETASVSYDVRATEVRRDDIASGYALASTVNESGDEIARGRYYKLDKNGNPVTEDNEPKAIGSLKISSSDADKAMEIISKYPHGEDGDLYTTDSEYFSLMLSMLSTEGVSYTNYTPAGSGDVKFRIVFN